MVALTTPTHSSTDAQLLTLSLMWYLEYVASATVPHTRIPIVYLQLDTNLSCMTMGVMAFAVLGGLDRTRSNMVQTLSYLVDRLHDIKKRHFSVPIRVRMMGDNSSPVDASL